MKASIRVVLGVVVCAAVAGPVLAAEAKAAKSAKPAAALTLTTPDQLKWEPNPGSPDVKVAVVWGDLKGPHGAFHKFPAGFTAPLHTHSADLKAVVISGTMIEAGADGKETKLPPGSFFAQPHTVKHVTKCDAGSECVIYATANKGFDFHPVEAAKK